MKALVTGSGGFLGGAIVRRLLAQGHSVRGFSRGQYPQLVALGVDQRQGDVADIDALGSAAAGCDVVFHVAAKAGIWGPYADYHRANVVGTENVIAVCRQHSIQRLVFTSSPSVIATGSDIEGVDESAPYPDRYEAHYPHTKALAEQAVLRANDNNLATVSLRPHLIWGPGDNHLIPRLLARARAGKLRQIGRVSRLVDHVYVDNAADAHLLAADRLTPGAPISGRSYFITQGEPLPLWDFINRILAVAELPPVTRHVPTPVAFAMGALLELVYGLLHLPGEPRMTRFLAHQLSTAHWFNIDAARRDLGYHPAVSLDEGLRSLGDFLKQNDGLLQPTPTRS
jgi:nucleoside-diphosphate-sugar epimerase